MADTNPQNTGGIVDLRGAGTTSAAGAGTAATGDASTTSAANPLSKFEIPDSVKQSYPDLIPLIVETESMNDEERQYWFQILPIMTEVQIQKLRDILVKEKDQLKKLDKDYEGELKRINDKHVNEWKEFEAKEKRRKLYSEESKDKQTEKATEEELLSKLQNL